MTVAACTATKDSNGSGTTTSTKPTKPVTPKPSNLAAEPFPLGVASGDPQADRVMLWTRVFPADPASTETIEVAYDVAKDDEFSDLVASGIAKAGPELAHSVHVDVTGLEPDTWYFYRFRAADATTTTARTRTFPKPDADANAFNFAFATCQDFQWGYYGAWASVAEEPDLDAVVFLGDYIYELSLGDLSPNHSGARVWNDSGAMTLADYRGRYAQTKSDKNLQAAHAAAPWIVTFDDHEVSDNYAGNVGGNDLNEPKSRDRRLAAYQAWFEHTPIRLANPPAGSSPEDFDELLVNRSFSFGKLANMFVIETRQHADVPACRTEPGLMTDQGPLCDATLDPERSNLGAKQEEWLVQQYKNTTATWNILANPVMLADMNIGTAEKPEYYRDMWIGYPAVRERILKTIVDAKVPNPVTITGDWHASFVLDVQSDPHSSSPKTVMPEFLVSSITTVLFADDYRANNPQIKYFKAEHGYAMVRLTSERFDCAFAYVDDIWNPDSRVSRRDNWSLAAGTTEPVDTGSTEY